MNFWPKISTATYGRWSEGLWLKTAPTAESRELIQQNLILGVDFWKAFDIVPAFVASGKPIEFESISVINEFQLKPILTTTQTKRLNQIVSILNFNQNNNKPTPLLTHTIKTFSSTPCVSKPYLYSPAIEAKVHKEIDRMLDIGVIEKSKSAWMNPMVVVTKPDGSLRLCLDSRQINSVTIPDGYPIPNINRILSRIKSTKIMSTIDLKEAYWQIGLDEESREKVAFMIPGKGLFQFRVLPYGLKNAAPVWPD